MSLRPSPVTSPSATASGGEPTGITRAAPTVDPVADPAHATAIAVAANKLRPRLTNRRPVTILTVTEQETLSSSGSHHAEAAKRGVATSSFCRRTVEG